MSDLHSVRHDLSIGRALTFNQSEVFFQSVGPIDINHVTTRRYLDIIENLLFVDTFSPWCTSTLKRLTKSPKLHFLDAGLSAAPVSALWMPR